MRRQPYVGDRRGRLPGQRCQQLSVGLVIADLAGTALDPPDDRIVVTKLLQERGGTGQGARHSLRLGKPRPGRLVSAVISLMS